MRVTPAVRIRPLLFAPLFPWPRTACVDLSIMAFSSGLFPGSYPGIAASRTCRSCLTR